MRPARSEGVRDLEIWNGNLEVRAYWRASEKAGGAPDMITAARAAREAPGVAGIGGRCTTAAATVWRFGSLTSAALGVEFMLRVDLAT